VAARRSGEDLARLGDQHRVGLQALGLPDVKDDRAWQVRVLADGGGGDGRGARSAGSSSARTLAATAMIVEEV
jgi:hypothetical protein